VGDTNRRGSARWRVPNAGGREKPSLAYFDAGAFVKRHLVERSSLETMALVPAAEMIATAGSSAALKLPPALARLLGSRLVKNDIARNTRRRCPQDWPDFVRVAVTEALVECADWLAWEHGLDDIRSAPMGRGQTNKAEGMAKRRRAA